jgi:gliding motility-associated protein GldM
MISMMYIVLTAMLALNVSTDVLNGFSLVQESLSKTIESTEIKNKDLYEQFGALKSQNPEKVGAWLNKANEVKSKTDSLYNVIETLKFDIVKAADGEEADVNNIQGKDNLDVSAQVALPSGVIPQNQRGVILKNDLNKYKDYVISLVKDSAKQEAFKQTFNTEDRIVNGDPMSWENARFSSMPVSATVTLLTKIQADLRNTESEVVSYLKNQVDASDFRVNKITAEVIPDASYITRGGTYKARIILAAVDSTKRPKITLNGAVLDSSVYEVSCPKVGQFEISGKIELPRADGTVQPYDFSSSYIVGEPTAIISADMMNVFYAGIENPISVSVPGVPAQNIMVSVSNGRLTRTAKGWSVRPTKAGTDCKISVSTKGDNGKVQNIGSKPFRVKLLPPPVAYIEYTKDGNPEKYKGSKPISKGALLSAKGIKAELDDADLDVRYQVLGFDLNFFDSMGNNLVKASSSGKFTGEQQEIMRKMSKGKKFFISRVRAKGPDGVEKILPPIEVIVN